MSMYAPCPCSSGKKFKFCCFLKTKHENQEDLEKIIVFWPLHFCLWSEINEGLSTVFISRKMPNGDFFAAFYLVDVWCLGVKNADLKKNLTQTQVQSFYNEWNRKMSLFPIEYEEARSLILGSVDYAKNLGFGPHADWKKAKCLIEPDRSYEEKFEFGKDGKPYYFSGPHDKNPEKIVEKMRKIGGDFTAFIDD